MRRRKDPVAKRVVSCLVPALRPLPPRLSGRILGALGSWALSWNRPQKQELDVLVARAAERLGCSWPVRPTAHHWAADTLRWHARDYLLERLNDRQIDSVIHISGRQHLDAAVAEGHGVLLLFNHFGPFLIHAHWMARHNYTLRWFTERPRRISKVVRRTFEADGPLGQRDFFLDRRLQANHAASLIRRGLRMLQAGMIVQAAGDVRWSGGRSVSARFLGREFSFTTNWVSLAACSGARVVPVFAIMNPDGTYRVEFLESESIGREAREPQNAQVCVQRNLDRLEDYIRRAPSNSGEYFYWLDGQSAAS
jgi:KDO2-lipid IV(A) lauroyltransferase